MFSEYLNNIVVGEGFLNLFANLLILTLVAAVLMLVSRKWTSSTRSFLLMGMITGYLFIIGWNLAFIAQPNKRLSMVSLTLPAIEPDRGAMPVLSEKTVSLDNSSANVTSAPENNIRLEKTRNDSPASFSRLIMLGASVGGIIWLCGSIVFVARLIVNLIGLECFKQRLTRVKDDRLGELLQKVKTSLDLKELPSLYSSAEIESPMTICIFHPVIVMPEKLLNVTSREEYLCILGHESGHIKHYDNLTGLLQRIFIALNWWNPLAYIISAIYSLTREDVCDDYAVRMTDDVSHYTACLVSLAEKSCLISSFGPAVGLVGCKRSLGQRLNRILGKGKGMNSELTRTRKLMLAVLCAVMILGCASIQTVFAQDYEAVGRRLRAAVAAGELTGEQARAMLGVLREARGDKKEENRPKKKVDYDAIGRKIRAAVQAGKMTKEEAKAKMEAIRKGADKKDIDINAIGRKIRMAVQAGKMTAEEGRAKMAAIRKETGGDKKDAGSDRAKAYLMKVRKELGEAVKAGKVSQEDAKKKYAAAEKAVKERMAAGRGERGERRITVEEYRRAEARMRKMIEEGKAKPEDVERRLIEMRKMMGDQRERKPQTRDIDWEGIKKRIEGAVKSGDMTREEADAKYKEIKERMAGGRRDTNARSRDTNARDPYVLYAAAEKRIKAAIEAGKMTEEEGREKMAGFRRRLGERARGKEDLPPGRTRGR